jgi:hypothetical protein
VRVVAPHKQKRGKHEIKRRKVAALQSAHSEQAALAAPMNNEAAHFFQVQKPSCRGFRGGYMLYKEGNDLDHRRHRSSYLPECGRFSSLVRFVPLCLALTSRASMSHLDPAGPAR